jgi:hypothetical protein
MLKLSRVLWAIIAVLSLFVFIYICLDEGFLKGKAYMFLLSMIIGIWGYGIKDIYIKYFNNKK